MSSRPSKILAPVASVPTPQSVLGFEVAARPVHCHEAFAYFRVVAAASDRVRLREYGRTFSGHPLIELVVSSPRNLARLDEHGKMFDRLVESEPGAAVPDELPASVWIGCGIHGDEISGTDATLALLHRLASESDATTLALLDRLVIHLDPIVNPDGRERFLAHTAAYRHAGAALDPQDLLHNPFWPGGRGNHYLFDLNRDAIFAVQAESRARVAAVIRAHPQVFIDMHEMSAADTYLFAVPAEPLNPHLPAPVHDSWRDIAGDHALAFDRAGVSYYTRSWNEVFYPGYFDIWPAYHGAVPVLYEQSATSGGAVRLPNGKLRTYREAVDNQLRSACANLATVAESRGKFIERWVTARRAANDAGSEERHWLMPPENTWKQTAILRLLLAQGVMVERLIAPVEATDLHSMWQASPLKMRLPGGTLRVRTRQPLGALVRNMLDFHVPVPRDFCERERRALDLGGRTLLFDVTAWSALLAGGVDAYWSRESPQGDWTQVRLADPPPASAVTGGRYGFVCYDESLHAGARLAAQGVRLRVAREDFALTGLRFPAGALLIRREDQPDDLNLDAVVEAENERAAARLIPVDGARILEGPDLGGCEFELLVQPHVAILTGACLSAPSSGAIWHLLDACACMPVTLLDFARLAHCDLAAYNVIVVGDCDDREMFDGLLKQGHLRSLEHWVRGGGTLIAMSGGAQALAGCGLTATRPRGSVLERHPPLALGRAISRMLEEDFVAGVTTFCQPSGDAGRITAPVIGAAARAFCNADISGAELPDQVASIADSLGDGASTETVRSIGERMRRYLPRGAYLRADLKPRHWLRYGVPDRLPVLFREGDALVAGGGVELVGRFAAPQELTLAGLVWPEAVGYLAGTAMLVRERLGRGHVLLFASDALFRGYSFGTERLFLNALLYGPALRGA